MENLNQTPALSERQNLGRERRNPGAEAPVQPQQVPACTGNCVNTITTTCSIRVPSLSVFFEPSINVGDTFPVTTDPFYLVATATECEAPGVITTPCGDITCMVPIYQVSVAGPMAYYFDVPAVFLTCFDELNIRPFCSDYVNVNNIVCYNCDGTLPVLCDGSSNVPGTATVTSITNDGTYTTVTFDITFTLPGC